MSTSFASQAISGTPGTLPARLRSTCQLAWPVTAEALSDADAVDSDSGLFRSQQHLPNLQMLGRDPEHFISQPESMGSRRAEHFIANAHVIEFISPTMEGLKDNLHLLIASLGIMGHDPVAYD